MKKNCIFVEGLPGCGKTEISKWIAERFEMSCLLEDASGYPNNFRGIAGMLEKRYLAFKDEYPFLEQHVQQHGPYVYIDTAELTCQKTVPKKLCSELMKWEFSDEFNPSIGHDFYVGISFELLKSRLETLMNTYGSLVLDGSWLQNIVNEFLYRDNTDAAFIGEYCDAWLQPRQDTRFICVYLKKESVEKSVEDCKTIKGDDWMKRMNNAIMNLPFADRHHCHAESAALDFFKKRFEIEQAIIGRNYIKTIEITVGSSWDQVKQEIESGICEYFQNRLGTF